MKKSRYTEEQMIGMLREADRTSVAAVAKAHGVSEQTLYTWRQRFGGMDSSDVKRRRPTNHLIRIPAIMKDYFLFLPI